MAKKILVIDDDNEIRDTIVFVLEGAGYEVVASEDAEILKKIKYVNPDLVIMDNWLSEWKSDASGEQLCRGLKSNPETNQIPVILISAVNNIREIAETGLCDDYLHKPFDEASLLEKVRKFV